MVIDYDLSHNDALHTVWDNSLSPAITIDSGEVVRFDCLNDSGPRITPDTVGADLPDIDFIGHHLTGPVAIRNATPGDVIQIDIEAVSHGDWGYTLIRGGDRGVGLLPEEFPDPYLFHWTLDDDIGWFTNGITVPLAPFPGVVGLAPGEPGEHPTGPPRRVGGNLDVKHLTAGSSVYLPVESAGGLLSIGDGHAAQGDGEVCVSAIETPTTVTATITLRPDLSLSTPQYRTNGPYEPTGMTDEGRGFATTGIQDTLMGAAKDALRSMIVLLHEEHGLSREEAYVLCSVAGDLKINEVVDAPNWVVSLHLAGDLFVQ